jgi:uncharacterized protein (TIGR00661 family)
MGIPTRLKIKIMIRMENRSFIFAIQGEGRGHLTQAISVYEMLVSRGFKVHAVLVGSSKRRELPEFFKKKISVPIISFQSPNFTTDPKNKSIRLLPSIWKSLRHIKQYSESLRLIHHTVKTYKPDAIINFYEPLAGWYARKHKSEVRHICIGHQYIYLHPRFEFPKGKWVDKMVIRNYTKLTSLGADALLALSFYPLPPAPNQRLKVLPPLLRKEVFEQDIHQQPFLLAYVLNAGYMQDIINWHKNHPEVELHCFTDSKAVKGKWRYDDTLCFHSLDDKKFLTMMASCKGLVCTAGFESVCEALYLGKPALMIPVGGHYEQFCNARDAVKAGAGIYDTEFNIERLLEFIPQYKVSEDYRCWIKGVEQEVLSIIETVLPPTTSSTLEGMEGFNIHRLNSKLHSII